MENAVVLREWFDRVDASRTGNITAPQLQSALAVGNLDFPLSVVQQMIRMYDFDRNGTMSFEEFLALNKFLQKVQSVFFTLERRQMTHAGQFSLCLFFYLYRKVSVFIYNAYSFCCLSFFLVNFRGRGFLSLEEVYEALIKLGFSLDSPAFYTVCESFDKSKKGMVHLDEFISLCIFVLSARNLFNSFDTSKQGRVSLDFNQFVYCTANCRI
ncbi:sorcin-like isoform X1 [Panicum virgatum]|uniref:EF-hand domain-containing protein n=1 Tax=Panicum virgatum TaxID=38727 RepID=A0A8T0N2Q5_PANVG|nr:sorcin-like isoform X1 [Panicum virgatum]KAG2543730.1 hypothetical protein PVAP13_9NG757000 [Panicum virgatum]